MILHMIVADHCCYIQTNICDYLQKLYIILSILVLVILVSRCIWSIIKKIWIHKCNIFNYLTWYIMYLSSICYMRNYTNIDIFNCAVRTEMKEKLCHCGRYFLLFFFFVMISKCYKEGAWRNGNALDSRPKDWGPIFSGFILANIIF